MGDDFSGRFQDSPEPMMAIPEQPEEASIGTDIAPSLPRHSIQRRRESSIALNVSVPTPDLALDADRTQPTSLGSAALESNGQPDDHLATPTSRSFTASDPVQLTPLARTPVSVRNPWQSSPRDEFQSNPRLNSFTSDLRYRNSTLSPGRKNHVTV